MEYNSFKTYFYDLNLCCQLLYSSLTWQQAFSSMSILFYPQAFTLDGFNIPVNYAVIYITQLAHRDPHVFLEPDMFRPARWKYE